jgi:alanine dehydrogenase
VTLILTASVLESLVDRKSTIDAVQQIFADISNRTATQPAPTSMSTEADTGRYVLMAAVSDGSGLAGVKLLSDLPDNPTRGLPSQRSAILICDRVSGEPLALLDGRVPTRVRTAAASAVGTRLLAREGSRTLGLVGAGALAREHVAALADVRPFEQILVWSRTRDRRDRFVEELDFGGEVIGCDDVREVVQQADVLCTLTPSVEPIIDGRWIPDGQHLNVVGARPRPDEREVDAATIARAAVWVDHRDTAWTKSGDLIMAAAEGAITEAGVIGDLGEVATGACPGRTSADQVTLFDSVGIGAQDLAIAHLLYQAAIASGVGESIDLAS